MPIEITDTGLLIGVIVAFLGGIFAVYLVNKVTPMLQSKASKLDPSQLERLEYYERQLIDMKIRLDAIELGGGESEEVNKSSKVNDELKNILEKITKKEEKPTTDEPTSTKKPIETRHVEPEPVEIEQKDITNYVLSLITQKPMTSRDIQITLKRSREHTSRLLKKLYDDGLVTRNTESKPYTYSISYKGKERIGLLNSAT